MRVRELSAVTLCMVFVTGCTASAGSSETPSPAMTTASSSPSATPTLPPQRFKPGEFTCTPRRTPEVEPASQDAWSTEAPRSRVDRGSAVELGLKARGRRKTLRVKAVVRTPRGAPRKAIVRSATLRPGKWAKVRLGKRATRTRGTYTVVWQDEREHFISCDGFSVAKG